MTMLTLAYDFYPRATDLDAKALTLELDGRWHERYGVARCVAASHVGGDRHPSMHIADGRNGRPVLVCRSQHCPDIIEGLRARGLWSTSTTSSSRAPRAPHQHRPSVIWSRPHLTCRRRPAA